MNRVLLLLGIVVLSFVSSYADQNITSCGAVITTVDNYFLNQSINASSGDCIEFQASASGSTLNCQGFELRDYGSSAHGLIVDANNMILSNCIIGDFNTFNVDISTDNITFQNTTLLNGVSDFSGVDNSRFINNTLNYEILRFGRNNNLFSNNTILNDSIINFISLPSFSNFTDSFFSNSVLSLNVNTENNNFINLVMINSTIEQPGIFNTITQNSFENITGNVDLTARNLYNNTFTNVDFDYIQLLANTVQNNTFSASSINNISSFNWSQTPNFFENNSYAQGIVNSSGCIIAAQPEVICDTGSWSVFSPVVSSTSSTSSLFPVFGLVNIIILLGGLFLYFI